MNANQAPEDAEREQPDFLEDEVIVPGGITADLTGSEDLDDIISDVRRGMTDIRDTMIEPDRRAAIAHALATARPGDVVVIAGKGHETI